jgi:hypothetical protein
MNLIHTFDIHIEPARQGSYFTIPFEVPPGIETLRLKYQYARRGGEEIHLENGVFTSRPEINIIDLGLIGQDGRQVGASGSDKTEIYLRETDATPGYTPCPLTPGAWQILVGAYKVAPEGVSVHYEVVFEEKHLRLLRGDLHTHTLASDGVHTLEELAWKALRNGLDFIAVTDHNQQAPAERLPRILGVTMIPGVEWTHFQGHANFLGMDQPYDEPFYTNTFEDTRAQFESARKRGALITINHPFEEICPFQFDFNQLPFDCLEVWNGPMREANLRALGLWQQMLANGRKIPCTGGSDYHRDAPFIFLGGPTMGVYALSAGVSDILAAIRQGHAFITFAPNGPTAELNAGKGRMGDSVIWNEDKELRIHAAGLLAGDLLQVVTGASSDVIFKAATDGEVSLVYPMAAPGFARIEILRSFIPGLPPLPALISNPVYFE